MADGRLEPCCEGRLVALVGAASHLRCCRLSSVLAVGRHGPRQRRQRWSRSTTGPASSSSGTAAAQWHRHPEAGRTSRARHRHRKDATRDRHLGAAAACDTVSASGCVDSLHMRGRLTSRDMVRRTRRRDVVTRTTQCPEDPPPTAEHDSHPGRHPRRGPEGLQEGRRSRSPRSTSSPPAARPWSTSRRSCPPAPSATRSPSTSTGSTSTSLLEVWPSQLRLAPRRRHQPGRPPLPGRHGPRAPTWPSLITHTYAKTSKGLAAQRRHHLVRPVQGRRPSRLARRGRHGADHRHAGHGRRPRGEAAARPLNRGRRTRRLAPSGSAARHSTGRTRTAPRTRTDHRWTAASQPG